MDQVGLEETFFDIVETVLVHPKHLKLAQGVHLWRTDVNLHVGMVCSLNLFDIKGLRHVFAVANGEDDGVAPFGQCIDHTDAEVAQSGVVGSGEPA